MLVSRVGHLFRYILCFFAQSIHTQLGSVGAEQHGEFLQKSVPTVSPLPDLYFFPQVLFMLAKCLQLATNTPLLVSQNSAQCSFRFSMKALSRRGDAFCGEPWCEQPKAEFQRQRHVETLNSHDFSYSTSLIPNTLRLSCMALSNEDNARPSSIPTIFA